MNRKQATREVELAPAAGRCPPGGTKRAPIAKSNGRHRAWPPRWAGVPAGVVLGELTGFDDAGHPLVVFSRDPTAQPVVARSTAALGKHDVGRSMVLMFEGGDPNKPIILGVLQQAVAADDRNALTHPGSGPSPLHAEIDGRQVTLTADHEIVLRCGKASITLTRAGKVLIRGAYLLSRSSGVNRIKGGSVQIN